MPQAHSTSNAVRELTDYRKAYPVALQQAAARVVSVDLS
jgi:hypothetical protein